MQVEQNWNSETTQDNTGGTDKGVLPESWGNLCNLWG